MPNLCPCADLDWRDVDMSREHHPDCPIQAMIASGIDLNTAKEMIERSGPAIDVIREVVDTLKTFDGFFDNIKVSDHALSADEVQNLYADTVKDTQPLAYLRLSETSGNQVMDSSGNERHGKILALYSVHPVADRMLNEFLDDLNERGIASPLAQSAITVEGQCLNCNQSFRVIDVLVNLLTIRIATFEIECPHCRKTMKGVIE